MPRSLRPLSVDAPADGANDAGGERSLESERIPDGQHFLAHLQRVGIAQLEEAELRLGSDLDQRQVVRAVDVELFRFVLALV